jgi:hypothetical protein
LGLMLLAYAGNLPQIANASAARVEGVVVDSDNKAVKDASVYATSSGPKPARPHTVLTNADGEFVLDNMPPGKIAIRAYKEGDKYPQISFKFDEPDAAASTPEIELKAGDVFKGVVIHLDRKAGSLQLRVLDAGTSELIRWITFQMCRGDHPGDQGYCISGSARGDYQLLVPAAVPISIKVSAPNHNEWVYQDQATKSPFIALAGGEERTLTINLQAAGTK